MDRWPRNHKASRVITRDAVVYVIKCRHDGLFKIGRTTKLKARIATLQTGSPDDLQLLVSSALDATGISAAGFEKMLHAWLKPWHHRGEWFDTTRQRVFLAWNQVAGELREKDKLSHGEVSAPQGFPQMHG